MWGRWVRKPIVRHHSLEIRSHKRFLKKDYTAFDGGCGEAEIDAEIKNESRLIDKFNADDGHPNIVMALTHGRFTKVRYFFDMAMCIVNSDDYIRVGFKFVSDLENYYDCTLIESNLGCLALWGITQHVTARLNLFILTVTFIEI